jgi:ubiquitin-conjugating enzyme E2 J1
MGSLETLSNKYNKRNASVKRILQEVKELQGQGKDNASAPLDIAAEALEENIFEWHFAIRGANGSEFEGGIYHGRILLPPEYPFKPPDFVMLTPSGRFQVGKRICLSISQHHPEHWQPSWSVRTALMALIAFMPTPGEGALGSLDYTKEEKIELAAKSRLGHPSFGNEARREVSKRIHLRMLQNDKHDDEQKKQADDKTVKEQVREKNANGSAAAAVVLGGGGDTNTTMNATSTSAPQQIERRAAAAGAGGSVGVTNVQERQQSGLSHRQGGANVNANVNANGTTNGNRVEQQQARQGERGRQRGAMDIVWSMAFWVLLALATGSVLKNIAKDFLL